MLSIPALGCHCWQFPATSPGQWEAQSLKEHMSQGRKCAVAMQAMSWTARHRFLQEGWQGENSSSDISIWAQISAQVEDMLVYCSQSHMALKAQITCSVAVPESGQKVISEPTVQEPRIQRRKFPCLSSHPEKKKKKKNKQWKATIKSTSNVKNGRNEEEMAKSTHKKL